MTPAARIAAVIEILSELPSGEIASVSAGAALRRGLQAQTSANQIYQSVTHLRTPLWEAMPLGPKISNSHNADN